MNVTPVARDPVVFKSMLRAKTTGKLPSIGSGVDLFHMRPQATGNSRLQVQVNNGGFYAVA